MRVYYFGCNERAGHFLWDPSLFLTQNDDKIPWRNIDGGLCPKNKEVEGEALLHVKDGWTAISFWDRSVDKRGACNSSFIAEGVHTFDEMCKIAQEKFPKVWGRFPFKITEYKPAK